ncbi:MAG: hypothetical protein JWP79_1020, partial [Polaromonas sp.]|nr:hypothetical protein [Polaromonas sp.]
MDLRGGLQCLHVAHTVLQAQAGGQVNDGRERVFCGKSHRQLAKRRFTRRIMHRYLQPQRVNAAPQGHRHDQALHRHAFAA